jgi:hypothetical protein
VRECRRDKEIEHVLHEAQETGHGEFTVLHYEGSRARKIPLPSGSYSMFRQRGTTDRVSVVVDGPGLYPIPMPA